MKPAEGRRRVVIEEVQPQVDGGKYAAKRVVGDLVEVTAAIFGDGHDHVAGRVLSRHESDQEWNEATFEPLTNDLWRARFPVDRIGAWKFTIEAWVDHFDTWAHDLVKRLDAQPDPKEPTAQVTPQDIPLALRIGANLLEGAAERAEKSDSSRLSEAVAQLRHLADANLPYYESPLTPELEGLAAQYPDLS